MDYLAIPVSIKRVLDILRQEKEDNTKWTLTLAQDGSFAMKIWTFPAKSGVNKETHSKLSKRSKTRKQPTPRRLNVDHPQSAGKEGKGNLENGVLDYQKSSKSKKKSPSQLYRDRKRRAAWLLRRKQSLPPRFSKSAEPVSNCLPENSLPVVLENQAVPEPNEPINSKSSVTNSDFNTSVLDSDDERVDSAPPLPKEVPEVCVECGKTEGKLYTCSKCKAVKYCGVKCQMENNSSIKLTAFLKGIFNSLG